ncbi:MAG: Sirohydrochlorin cobaltochelatase CbiKP precursor [Pelotomaculum sp. PtaU1.Bin065]|nr:MAG: Sirohydrochlorin cobaltochelatase CbiKP precursor [Pelotomaculum sp. PtaU1.Bin065]
MQGIKRLIMGIFIVSLVLLSVAPAMAGESEKEKKAILLVTFGTSVQSAMPAYNNLEQAVKDAFPGVEVRWAYTSKLIRDKIAKRDGRIVDAPFTALSKLRAEGYGKVVVQSDHIFPGQEYSDLLEVVNSFLTLQTPEGEFGPRKMSLGRPLLYHHADYVDASVAIASQFPADTASNAVVLMGHGSEHPSASAYGKLNDILRHEYKNVFLGTVEGYPGLEEVKKDLAASGVKRATLIPFMNIAGDHALNDLDGDEEDSWKSQLNRLGYETDTQLKGLLENKAIVDIFVKHLAAAMAELDEKSLKDAEVRVNGEKIAYSEPPRADGDLIMAQMRPTFEAMGFSVSWDENEGAAVAEKSGLTVSFRPGSGYALVNGVETALDAECQAANNGSTMIPLSFFSKRLGYSVNWDADGNINIFNK